MDCHLSVRAEMEAAKYSSIDYIKETTITYIIQGLRTGPAL